MRFFKHGEKSEVLAIVLPPHLQKSSGVAEGDEYEFIEVAPGAFLLVKKQLADKLVADSVLGKLGQKMLATEKQEPEKEKIVAKPTPQSFNTVSAPKPVVRSAPSVFEKELEKNGFLITEEEQAKSLSSALEAQIKHGEVLGVRGFDKRYYIVSRGFYEGLSAKIKEKAGGEEFSASAIAASTKTSENACVSVLQVMKEEGTLIEKKRGSYQLVK